MRNLTKSWIFLGIVALLANQLAPNKSFLLIFHFVVLVLGLIDIVFNKEGDKV